MRKGRFVIADADEAIYKAIKDDPSAIFTSLEPLAIGLTTWANVMCLITFTEKPKLDVSFFEDAKDFFIWYSKLSMSSGKFVISAFAHENDKWHSFIPPTLIGIHFRTKLR